MQVNDVNRSRRTILVLSIICALAELIVAPALTLGNGHPNFAIILTACVALSFGGRRGVLTGFAAGLFYDFCTTGPVGLMALLLTIAAYALGLEVRNRLADDRRAAWKNYILTCVIVEFIYNAMMLVVGNASSFIALLMGNMLPSVVLDVLLFIPFAYFLSRSPASRSFTHGSARGMGQGGPAGHFKSSR